VEKIIRGVGLPSLPVLTDAFLLLQTQKIVATLMLTLSLEPVKKKEKKKKDKKDVAKSLANKTDSTGFEKKEKKSL
jgi:hypothetical protein